MSSQSRIFCGAPNKFNTPFYKEIKLDNKRFMYKPLTSSRRETESQVENSEGLWSVSEARNLEWVVASDPLNYQNQSSIETELANEDGLTRWPLLR